MANIYKQQQTSNLAHKVYSAEGNPAQNVIQYGEQMQKQAQQYEDKAKVTYAKALDIQSQQTMQQLYDVYGNDPVALEEEFGKAYEKILGEIVDDDVKVDFIVNSQLKSQTYLAKAEQNKKKADYRAYKSSVYDSILENTNMAGISFSNMLGETYNEGDIINYNRAVNANSSLVNTLNEDGTYMFSDVQRENMVEDFNKAQLKYLKDYYNNLEPHQQEQYLSSLNEDGISLVVGVDENKNFVRANLQDMISPENYHDFKMYAQQVYERASSIKKKNKSITPEQANAIASVQTMNDIVFDEDLSKILDESDEEDRTMNLLAFRSALMEKSQTGELDEKDFKKYMEKTVIPLSEMAEKGSLEGSWYSRDTAMNGLIDRMENLLEAVSSYEKAYIYQMCYDELGNAGLLEAMESGNDTTLDNMSLLIKSKFEKKKNAGLIGEDVAKVLVNGTVQDYSDKKSNLVQGKDYKIFEKSSGVRYKVYKDEEGNFSEKSLTERIF